MKLVSTVSLIVAVLAHEATALPNAYTGPHPFFGKRAIPARFKVTSHETINGVQSTTVENTHMTALYEIPDDLKNWPWWCSEDRSYCDAAWAPTVDEGNALSDYLSGLGNQECVIERPQNSNVDGYTGMAQISNHAKVGLFFTHLGDTDRAWKASFMCTDLGYILRSLVEACQCNGKIVGSTPIPNCWLKSMSFTGDQSSPPGGGAAYPGAGVGIAPYP